MYSADQIKAAKEFFELHKVCKVSEVTQGQAVAFLKWWKESPGYKPMCEHEPMLRKIRNRVK